MNKDNIQAQKLSEDGPELHKPNRKARRELEQARKRLNKKENKVVKQMVKKHDETGLENLGKQATIAEVIQLATAIVNDSINEYHKQANPVIVSLSLHMEIFKATLIENGILTEEKFDELFAQSVEVFNKVREEKLEEYGQPNPEVKFEPSTDLETETKE